MLHLHLTSIIVAIVLFFVSAMMQKGSTAQKITHMILRLFYILILFSGGYVFSETMASPLAMEYGLKLLGGLLVIGLMEIILVRKEKEKTIGFLWILFIIILAFTLYMGYRLPL